MAGWMGTLVKRSHPRLVNGKGARITTWYRIDVCASLVNVPGNRSWLRCATLKCMAVISDLDGVHQVSAESAKIVEPFQQTG